MSSDERIIKVRFKGHRLRKIFWTFVLLVVGAVILTAIFHFLEKEPVTTMLVLIVVLFAGIAVLGPRKKSPPPARRGAVVAFPTGRPAA